MVTRGIEVRLSLPPYSYGISIIVISRLTWNFISKRKIDAGIQEGSERIQYAQSASGKGTKIFLELTVLLLVK